VIDDAITKVELEQIAEGFDSGLAWKKVSFRGTVYKLVELEIGEHNKIEDLAKETRTDSEGNDVEVVNSRTQNRLMLEKSIVEPKGTNVAKIGTRLYGNLLRVMQDLHYTPEADELRPPKKDGEKKPGN
jgi:hypothetical protein